jgi:hypothetical protein
MWRADDWHDSPLAQRSRRACRIALLCYLVPMTVATHWPRLAFEGAGTTDKFIHFVGFGLLAWLFMGASFFRRPVFNLALGAIWVYLDEVTQAIEILGRTFSLYDMIAGWLGCAVAGLVWWGLRQRAPHATDDRLDDLTAERLVYGGWAGWRAVAFSVLGFAAVFIGGSVAVHLLVRGGDIGDIGVGNLVFSGTLALIVGVAYGGVGAFVRAFARVGRGRIDAWTGAVEQEGAPFRSGDYAPALRMPMLLAVPLVAGAWYAVTGVEHLLFREPNDENMVDFAGFALLRPIFTAMLAFAGAVVAAGMAVSIRRAKRGFLPLRTRP